MAKATTAPTEFPLRKGPCLPLAEVTMTNGGQLTPGPGSEDTSNTTAGSIRGLWTSRPTLFGSLVPRGAGEGGLQLGVRPPAAASPSKWRSVWPWPAHQHPRGPERKAGPQAHPHPLCQALRCHTPTPPGPDAQGRDHSAPSRATGTLSPGSRSTQDTEVSSWLVLDAHPGQLGATLGPPLPEPQN